MIWLLQAVCRLQYSHCMHRLALSRTVVTHVRRTLARFGVSSIYGLHHNQHALSDALSLAYYGSLGKKMLKTVLEIQNISRHFLVENWPNLLQ